MRITKVKRHFVLTSLLFLVSATITIALTKLSDMEVFFFSESSEIIEDPELIGPKQLCNVYGSIIGDFFGAGNPTTDVYSWKIYSPSGELLFDKSGGASFQTISYTFDQIGTHQVELTVNRPGFPVYSNSQEVELILGPKINLLPKYELCDTDGLSISALDPSSSNFSSYNFIWEDSEGNVVGNSNTITINESGTYSCTFYFEDENGLRSCETTVSTNIGIYSGFEIISSTPSVCPDNTVTFSNSLSLFGDWYYKSTTGTEEVFLGEGESVFITPVLNFPSPGKYDIIFKPDPVSGNECLSPKSYTLTYFPQPEFIIIDSQGSSECLVPDGSITIQAITTLDNLFIEEIEASAPPLSPGQIYQFKDLKSGAYTITGVLGGCQNELGSVVTLISKPEELEYNIENIIGESCTEEGKLNGFVDINFPNGPINGWYRFINEKGNQIRNAKITEETSLQIEIPGGKYYFELYGEDSCRIPKPELVEVPGLARTFFTVPNFLTICQSYELVPFSNQNLDYRLVHPDSTLETISNGAPIILSEEGKYKITGFIPNQEEICPSTLEFEVKLVDPVEFNPVLIKQDCFGNRTYFADIFGADPNDVIFTWYDENDEIVGTGQTMFPTSFGEFKLDVQPANSASCPIPPKSFMIDELILEVDVTLVSTKLCELGPGSIITLSTTFPEEITDIEWRRYDSSGNIENLDQFKDQKEITVLREGTYEASVYSIIPSIQKDCELGRNSIDIKFSTDEVSFFVPESLSICETFEFIPPTDQPLEFILTFPDGTTAEKKSGEPFTLNQTGTYSLFGFNPEASSPDCPVIKEFYVEVNLPIPFSPILIEEDCNGQKVYQAQLTGASAKDVLIYWYDKNGNVISNGEFLTIENSAFGNYFLEVQPINSEPCNIQPIEFEVKESIVNVDVYLNVTSFCPDDLEVPISIEANLEAVSSIEWWFTDLNGTQVELTNQKDNIEIFVENEGTYEVRLFNSNSCLLGSDLALVTRSLDQNRPELEETYKICPKYDIIPTLNPGNFSSYLWYHSGSLVSTSSTYRPLQAGEFELVVYTDEGCSYSTTFETIEECELKVSYPNAIELGNPDKGFLVYTNYLIDELEVLIFNKWGQVVFQCNQTELISEESTCYWDGTFNGEKIPNGTYSIRLNFVNLERNIKNHQIGSILVID